MNVIQKIKSISDTLECQFIYDSLVKRIQKIQRKSIVIGVLGAANAGKSSIINALAGTSLPTSFLSSMQSNFVSFKNEGMSVVISSSEWMKTLQISFLEKVEKMFSCESEDIEYATYFADFDSCLYIIDAQMAYTKNDALIIEHLKKLGIPTLVCVSKYEKLPMNERQEVFSYLANKLPESEYITMVDNEKFVSMMNNVSTVVEAIEKLNDSENTQSVRSRQTRFFIMDAFVHLYEECKNQMDKCIDSEQHAERITAEKMHNLSVLETEWMRIEFGVSTRRQTTENKLRERLAIRKSDMLRRLSHEIEVCPNVGYYWNKELGFRIDEMMRAELQACTQLINMDMVSTIRWLQEEMQRTFKKQTSFIPTITCSIDGKETTLENINKSDNKNLKIITRVGTLATTFVAGCIATSGISGILIATSMLSGLVADWVLENKNNYARTKVMELLPSVLEKSELVYVGQVSESLKKTYGEIFKNLKASQTEWKNQSLKNIEEERKNAIHDCNGEKLQKCMQEINENFSSFLNESI